MTQSTLPADNGAEAIKIEVCKGQAGLALYINDERVDGVRHNGQMYTVLSATVPAALSAPAPAQGAIADIAAERRRQIEAEGWSQDHDDAHRDGEMARAAGIYALVAGAGPTAYRNALGGYHLGDYLQAIMDHYWPWDRSWCKPTNRRRDLVKAGALIVAEIERLDRLTAPTPQAALEKGLQ